MPSGIYIRTEEHKQKLSKAKLSNPTKYWLGKKRPYMKRLDMRGKNNSRWTGDNVSYRALHAWVQGWLGKANHCENNLIHIATRYHWSNISGEYKRDLKDWKQLCPKCNLNDNIKIPERLKGGSLLYYHTQ
jgi:hypothetical protein